MKYVFLTFILIFLFHADKAFGQGQANIWYFGENAGLDFNSGFPVAITDGQSNCFEGSASISDADGNLLFYTDGSTVWNRNHDTLQNGFGLLGEPSSTQAALIIPKPGSSTHYYIFTTAQAQRFEDFVFCYSELDMSLDGGFGGITNLKNVLLYEPIGEKVTAVKHANNVDLWVITHDKYTNKYLTYLVTSAGVNTTPIVYNGGTTDNSTENIGIILYSPNRGYLKASPDGSKLACAFSTANKVDLLDFNNATGQITFRFTSNQINFPYGVEFSPNSNLLYVASYTQPTLRQYNLSLSTPAAILSSSVLIPSIDPNTIASLQLGPDEKIYVSNLYANTLDCIQNPNLVGLSCSYTRNSISLNGKRSTMGLPNIAPILYSASGIQNIGICSGSSTQFSLENTPLFDSIQWNFGDPESGLSNTSNLMSPEHIYSEAGNYLVSITYYYEGQATSLQKAVYIVGSPSISLSEDTSFCTSTYFPLDIEGFSFDDQFSFSQGIFDDAFSLDTFFVYQEGLQWFTVSNSCGLSSDSIYVQEISSPQPFSLYGDQALCEGTSYSIGTAPAVGNYLWQDGSTEPTFLLSDVGEYYVTVSNACGSQSDTMLITSIIPPLTAELGNDTSICAGNSLMIYPEGNFDVFYWQTPMLSYPIYVTETNTYSITAYNGCGVINDTIHVNVDTIAPIDVDLGEDAFICEGQSLTLNIAQPGVSYLWQDGSTDSVFTTTIGELIIGSALNSCGQKSDTLFVFYNPLPDVSLGPDISVCDEEFVTLNASNNTNSYLWQNGSTQNTINVNSSGLYWVNSSNNCGTATDSVYVKMGETTAATLVLDACKPISVNGISYSQSGIYTQTLFNSSGCDSILTIDAEILDVNAQIFENGETLYYNGNPSSIQWFNCITGQIIPGATQTIFTPAQPGNYGAIVSLGACSDTSNCLITSVFPNSKTSNLGCNYITLAPNPSDDFVSFTLKKESYPIRLYAASGAVLWQKVGNSEKQEISLAQFPPAVYVLEVDQCRFKIVKN